MFLQSHANPECNSDEADSRSGGGGGGDNKASSEERPPASNNKRRRPSAGTSPAPEKTTGNGSPAEPPRRPRGRPPGSKNKPKPPIIVTRDSPGDQTSPAAMQPYVLEIAAGEDIVGTLGRFSRNRNLGLSVISGTGVVSGVVLHSTGNLNLPGVFEILSISATFFPPSFSPPASSALQPGGAAVTLAGPNGQIFGGLVTPPLRAAAVVTIIAAIFKNPSYHRLPAEDDISVSANCSSPPSSSSPATKTRRSGQSAAEPGGPSIFSPQLPSDAIWAPPARSPPY